MKLRNKLIIVAATVLVVGGAGTGVALAMQDEKVATEQSASVEPQNEPVGPVVEQEPTPEPVVQEEVPAEPQETIQQEAERRTKEHAVKFQLDPEQQWLWMNINLERQVGYSDEQKVRDVLDARLQERQRDDGGYTVIYWDGWTRTATKTVYLD